MEIELRRVGGGDGWRCERARLGDYVARQVELCGEAVEKRVSIPNDVNKIYAVFSKGPPNHEEYWEIRRGDEPAEFGLKGVREGMLYQTAEALCEVYGEGYRYVWIEY